MSFKGRRHRQKDTLRQRLRHALEHPQSGHRGSRTAAQVRPSSVYRSRPRRRPTAPRSPVQRAMRLVRALHRVPAPDRRRALHNGQRRPPRRRVCRRCAGEGTAGRPPQACRSRLPRLATEAGTVTSPPGGRLALLSDTNQKRYHGRSVVAQQHRQRQRRLGMEVRTRPFHRARLPSAASSHASTVMTNGSASFGYPGCCSTASRLMPCPRQRRGDRRQDARSIPDHETQIVGTRRRRCHAAGRPLLASVVLYAASATAGPTRQRQPWPARRRRHR